MAKILDTTLRIKELMAEDDQQNGVLVLVTSSGGAFVEVGRIRLNMKAVQELKVGTPVHILLETPEIVKMLPPTVLEKKRFKKKV
jgi:ClpP class serine protease